MSVEKGDESFCPLIYTDLCLYVGHLGLVVEYLLQYYGGLYNQRQYRYEWKNYHLKSKVENRLDK